MSLKQLNLHYLQHFYHVALHGGVTKALPKIPYGIGAPAVRIQIKQLEAQVGVPLFHRRPFGLTPAGQRLFAFIKPFFDQIGTVVAQLGAKSVELLRVASTRVVFRTHFPEIFEELRPSFPNLTCVLREGLRWQIDPWFAAREIDLAITVLGGEIPSDCESELLLRLPMELLVHRKSRLKSVKEVLEFGPINRVLIGPIPEDIVCRTFHEALAARGKEWQVGMQATSMEVIDRLVAAGTGVGLSVAVPGRTLSREVVALTLTEFPKLDVGLIWRRNPSPAMQALLHQLRVRASRLRDLTK